MSQTRPFISVKVSRPHANTPVRIVSSCSGFHLFLAKIGDTSASQRFGKTCSNFWMTFGISNACFELALLYLIVLEPRSYALPFGDGANSLLENSCEAGSRAMRTGFHSYPFSHHYKTLIVLGCTAEHTNKVTWSFKIPIVVALTSNIQWVNPQNVLFNAEKVHFLLLRGLTDAFKMSFGCSPSDTLYFNCFHDGLHEKVSKF